MNKCIRLQGVWMVYWGVLDKVEGNSIITFSGWFDTKTLTMMIAEKCYDSLDYNTQKQIDEYGRLVVRNMVRIGDA